MPVASEVDIVNLALVLIGAKPLLGFDDVSKEGALARTSYAAIRDTVLESHPWKFATKRVDLVKDASAPAFGYASQWILPEDHLRVVEVQGTHPDLPWTVEGNFLLCDIDAPCSVRYIWRNETVTTYSPGFVKALAQRIQAEWSESLTRNATVQQAQFTMADRQSLTAQGNNGQEQAAPILGAEIWIDSR